MAENIPPITLQPAGSNPAGLRWPFIALFSFLLGIASVLAYQKYQPTRSVLVAPLPSPKTEIVDLTANWKTYTSEELKFTLKYPLSFRVSKNSKDKDIVTIDLNQTEGMPSRWISIYKNINWSKNWLNKLSDVKIGETILSEGVGETQKEWSIWTRVADTTVDSKKWLVFENKNPWETPPPLRIYVINYKNNDYIIQATYSKLANSTAVEETNFTNIIDLILSTFKFID